MDSFPYLKGAFFHDFCWVVKWCLVSTLSLSKAGLLYSLILSQTENINFARADSFSGFKAIYPGVPPGIFADFPGVAHFLSFEEICLYPRVPQGKVANPWGTLGYYFPGVDPREIKISGVHVTFLKHLKFTNFLNEQYLVFLCTFLLIFSYSSFYILLIHLLLFFTSCSSLLIFLILFFSSRSFLLIIIFLHFKLYVLLQTCILIIYINPRNVTVWEKICE